MRIVLLGAPGAGKGTQAQVITAHLGIPHISSGHLLRTVPGPDGDEARRYIDRGEFVPDRITFGVVRSAIDGAPGGFLLDGFPRTVAQAEALDQALDGRPIDLVIALAIDDAEVIRRLAGRRACPTCGRTWHVEFDPPAVADVCDDCGSALVRRDDDEPATITRRLAEYAAQTAPLRDFYAREGKLVEVDATGTLADVAERVVAALRAGYAAG